MATILVDLIKRQICSYLPIALGLSVLWLVLYFLLNQKLRESSLLHFGLIFLLLLAVVNTIHEFIQTERQKQQAVAASEAKERFLANMSHEIRTPIKAILGIDTMIFWIYPTSRLFGDDIRLRQILVNLMNNAVKYTQKEPKLLLETICDFYRSMDMDYETLLNFLKQIQELVTEEHSEKPDCVSSDEQTYALKQFKVKVHSMKSSSSII